MVLLLPRWALGWRAWSHGVLAAATAASAWLSTRRWRRRLGSAGQPSSMSTRLLALASRLAAPVFLGLLAGALSVLTNMIIVAIGDRLPAAIASLGLRPLGLLDFDGPGGRGRASSAGRTTTPC